MATVAELPFGSMRRFLIILNLLMLLGCSQQRVATLSASNSDAGVYSDMRPSGDSHFTTEEQRIVAAARAYLEKTRQNPLDARYRVERIKGGYKVFAMFVGGYENGHPLYYPGGHGIVFLRTDGSFVRYMPGE